jgi:hypothetical protein
MDASSILNVLAVAVSFGALAVSLVFATRQTRIMWQSNQVPLFVDLITEFRSKEFQHAEQYVLHKLGKEHSPDNGLLGLPDPARFAAATVQSFFGTVGQPVMHGIISEASTVSTIGQRGSRVWDELEPFIAEERRIRGDDDFAMFYEDFVYRTRINWPPETSYKLLIHRLTDLEHGTGEESS